MAEMPAERGAQFLIWTNGLPAALPFAPAGGNLRISRLRSPDAHTRTVNGVTLDQTIDSNVETVRIHSGLPARDGPTGGDRWKSTTGSVTMR
jgi:hypothetical protein